MITICRTLGGKITLRLSKCSSCKSTNTVICTHKHSSLVTPKESHKFPGIHTSMDVSFKSDSGSKLPSHVGFSEDATLDNRQYEHARVHFLTSTETPGHQNCDTYRQWALYTPVCTTVGDTWHAENTRMRITDGNALVLRCMQHLKLFP